MLASQQARIPDSLSDSQQNNGLRGTDTHATVERASSDLKRLSVGFQHVNQARKTVDYLGVNRARFLQAERKPGEHLSLMKRGSYVNRASICRCRTLMERVFFRQLLEMIEESAALLLLNLDYQATTWLLSAFRWEGNEEFGNW
jgi:hypothetical protein